MSKYSRKKWTDYYKSKEDQINPSINFSELVRRANTEISNDPVDIALKVKTIEHFILRSDLTQIILRRDLTKLVASPSSTHQDNGNKTANENQSTENKSTFQYKDLESSRNLKGSRGNYKRDSISHVLPSPLASPIRMELNDSQRLLAEDIRRRLVQDD